MPKQTRKRGGGWSKDWSKRPSRKWFRKHCDHLRSEIKSQGKGNRRTLRQRILMNFCMSDAEAKEYYGSVHESSPRHEYERIIKTNAVDDIDYLIKSPETMARKTFKNRYGPLVTTENNKNYQRILNEQYKALNDIFVLQGIDGVKEYFDDYTTYTI